MAQGSDLNDVVLSTKETTPTTSTGTLTSPPLLPTLPFDVLPEILCRLPVKLLVQLRCLCKFFNSLISDPKFAKKHLQFSTKCHHLIVPSRNNSGELVLIDFPIPSVFSTSSVFTQTQLVNPCKDKAPMDLHSCDGILCFRIDNTSAVLWNPSIRKLNILPPLHRESDIPFIYSFGYDPFIHNYKVVGISRCINNKNEVSVNTLGTDYWRRIQDFPYSSYINGTGVFVSGTVNWLAWDDVSKSYALVSLGLENESYQTLPLPNLEKKLLTLGVVRDCLCIFARSRIVLDIWIMKEYGNKESWIKLYSVPYMRCPFSDYSKALYISEDDQLLMDFDDDESRGLKLVVYDFKNATFKITQIQNIIGWMAPNVYIESLISPCS